MLCSRLNLKCINFIFLKVLYFLNCLKLTFFSQCFNPFTLLHLHATVYSLIYLSTQSCLYLIVRRLSNIQNNSFRIITIFAQWFFSNIWFKYFESYSAFEINFCRSPTTTVRVHVSCFWLFPACLQWWFFEACLFFNYENQNKKTGFYMLSLIPMWKVIPTSGCSKKLNYNLISNNIWFMKIK